MKLKYGSYIISTDSLENMWISQIKQTKQEDGSVTESVKRITGYQSNFKALMNDFAHKSLCSCEAQSLGEVLAALACIENDIKGMCDKYAAEVKEGE